MLSLSSQTYFKCDTNYSFVYNWTMTFLLTGFSVDLTANPTSTASQLVIPAYTLPYGVYGVQIRANLIANASYNTFYSTATSYVHILPTGLVINALQNGVSSQLVGSNQAFVLDPASFSLDLDYLLTNMSSLSFAFFCTIISANTVSSSQNLLACKTNPSSCTFLANQTCFSSTSIEYKFVNISPFYSSSCIILWLKYRQGDYTFDSIGNKLTVAAQALKYVSASLNSYLFTVQTVYMSNTYSQQMSVQISASFGSLLLATLK